MVGRGKSLITAYGLVISMAADEKYATPVPKDTTLQVSLVVMQPPAANAQAFQVSLMPIPKKSLRVYL